MAWAASVSAALSILVLTYMEERTFVADFMGSTKKRLK
jgi:hypothetical protein